MIVIARIIEAWRDARIFEFPTEPRGRGRNQESILRIL